VRRRPGVLNKRIDDTVLSTLENIATADFAHITYTEAIAILEKANRPFEFPVSGAPTSSPNTSAT